MMKKISLYVMSRKGYAVLQDLLDAGYTDQIDKVVIAHDKNMANDYYDEMYSICKNAGISIFDKSDNVTVESAYCITIAWRWMIPLKEHTKLIVFHDSLLPKYRGFSPLVNMLINREPFIGVSALFASNEYDKGNIISQKKIAVDYPIKISDAIDAVSPLFSEIVCEIFEKIRRDQEIKATPQIESEATYSLWRDEEDYHIDWNSSAKDIQQFVYSVGYPFKGAYTTENGIVYRIINCEPMEDVTIENRTPGKMIFLYDGCPVVVCGSGLLRITEATDEDGKTVLPLKKFRNRFK